MTQDIERFRPGFKAADHAIKRGEEYPYDAAGPAKDWAHAAARGVLYDLSDRRGIKHELRAVEPDVRDELTASLADIIRTARKLEASTEPSAPGEYPCDYCGQPGWHICRRRDAQKDEAKGAAPGDALDAGTRAALSDALNTTLWLYRRLPFAYGKPPFVDAGILTMAKYLGMEHVPECIRERAAIAKSTSKGQADAS